jgi:excisionase family DNA binding protein
MPATKTRTAKRVENGPATVATVPIPVESTEVLTLAEAAAYLRVPETEVQFMLHHPGFPARRIGNEWRFLRSALHDWLRQPPARPSKEAVLSAIGSWKDDPYLHDLLKEIDKQRGRDMTEAGA